MNFQACCQHINSKNEKDCEGAAKYLCECCGVAVCEEHKEARGCPYGGQDYIEFDEFEDNL